jgi:hypothetical protein
MEAFSELTVSSCFIWFEIGVSGRVGDGPGDEAGVAMVEPGDGVAEADGDAVGDAGGEPEDPLFAA